MPVSPAEVGTYLYLTTGLRKQRRRCTNRCTKSFRPCPINSSVADYCRRIRLIPLSPANELPTVTAEVASSSLVVPAIILKHLRKVGLSSVGTKRNNKKIHFVPPATAT